MLDKLRNKLYGRQLDKNKKLPGESLEDYKRRLKKRAMLAGLGRSAGIANALIMNSIRSDLANSSYSKPGVIAANVLGGAATIASALGAISSNNIRKDAKNRLRYLKLKNKYKDLSEEDTNMENYNEEFSEDYIDGYNQAISDLDTYFSEYLDDEEFSEDENQDFDFNEMNDYITEALDSYSELFSVGDMFNKDGTYKVPKNPEKMNKIPSNLKSIDKVRHPKLWNIIRQNPKQNPEQYHSEEDFDEEDFAYGKLNKDIHKGYDGWNATPKATYRMLRAASRAKGKGAGQLYDSKVSKFLAPLNRFNAKYAMKEMENNRNQSPSKRSDALDTVVKSIGSQMTNRIVNNANRHEIFNEEDFDDENFMENGKTFRLIKSGRALSEGDVAERVGKRIARAKNVGEHRAADNLREKLPDAFKYSNDRFDDAHRAPNGEVPRYASPEFISTVVKNVGRGAK